MAIYRLSASVIKRSAGRSAVAAAAYRSGTNLYDERTGQRFDYTRRHGVPHAAILTPKGAPAWMADRARLWNAVEAAEKRKDAQLAREVQFALPHELTPAQRLALVTGFVRDEFVKLGMVADIALLAPDHGGDQRNHHAHVMLTLRGIAGEGFGPKCRDWNQPEQLEAWRARWMERVNLALKQAGHAARIDHRSLEAQGIEREAQPKLGPAATEMERRGIETDRGDELREVLDRNAERIRLTEEAYALDRSHRQLVLDLAGANLSAAVNLPAGRMPPAQERARER